MRAIRSTLPCWKLPNRPDGSPSATGKPSDLAALLDLTDIPAIPGLFEYDPECGQYASGRALTFLHHVAEQISQPVARDDRVHIEYVPTQVVTEFLRSRVRWQRAGLDGIKYNSSAHPGHAAYAFFVNQDHVLTDLRDDMSEETPWLELIDMRHRSVGLAVQPTT